MLKLDNNFQLKGRIESLPNKIDSRPLVYDVNAEVAQKINNAKKSMALMLLTKGASLAGRVQLAKDQLAVKLPENRLFGVAVNKEFDQKEFPTYDIVALWGEIAQFRSVTKENYSNDADVDSKVIRDTEGVETHILINDATLSVTAIMTEEEFGKLNSIFVSKKVVYVAGEVILAPRCIIKSLNVDFTTDELLQVNIEFIVKRFLDSFADINDLQGSTEWEVLATLEEYFTRFPAGATDPYRLFHVGNPELQLATGDGNRDNMRIEYDASIAPRVMSSVDIGGTKKYLGGVQNEYNSRELVEYKTALRKFGIVPTNSYIYDYSADSAVVTMAENSWFQAIYNTSQNSDDTRDEQSYMPFYRYKIDTAAAWPVRLLSYPTLNINTSAGTNLSADIAANVARAAAATGIVVAVGIYSGVLAANVWNPVGWAMAAIGVIGLGVSAILSFESRNDRFPQAGPLLDILVLKGYKSVTDTPNPQFTYTSAASAALKRRLDEGAALGAADGAKKLNAATAYLNSLEAYELSPNRAEQYLFYIRNANGDYVYEQSIAALSLEEEAMVRAGTMKPPKGQRLWESALKSAFGIFVGYDSNAALSVVITTSAKDASVSDCLTNTSLYNDMFNFFK